jgi:hypothetical protein
MTNGFRQRQPPYCFTRIGLFASLISISSTAVWRGGEGGGGRVVDTGNLSIFVCHVFGSFLKAYSSRSYVASAYG